MVIQWRIFDAFGQRSGMASSTCCTKARTCSGWLRWFDIQTLDSLDSLDMQLVWRLTWVTLHRTRFTPRPWFQDDPRRIRGSWWSNVQMTARYSLSDASTINKDMQRQHFNGQQWAHHWSLKGFRVLWSFFSLKLCDLPVLLKQCASEWLLGRCWLAGCGAQLSHHQWM